MAGKPKFELGIIVFQITIPEEDRIDTGAIYTKLSLQELKEEVPQMDWDEYFDTVLAGVPYHHQVKGRG